MSEEFEALVAKDVRHGCTPDETRILESDLRGWLNELNSLKRDVEVQLAALKARMSQRQAEILRDPELTKADWLEYKEGEERWRVGAIRFMVSVEERILYVKALRASLNQKVMVA